MTRSEELPSVSWFRAGRASEILNRGIRKFDAVLPSKYDGVSFSARINGKIFGPVNDTKEPAVLAAAIRHTLREAAKDVTSRADPSDLAHAADMCNHRLAKPLPIPSQSDVTATATVSLRLNSDNRKALSDLVAARRRQATSDVPLWGRASAIREHFTDPAFVLSWWLSNNGETVNNFPSVADIQAISDQLKDYSRATDNSIEYQLLDLLRAFIAEFPEHHQKRALITLLSSGFQRAGADELARQAQSLASDDIAENGTHPM